MNQGPERPHTTNENKVVPAKKKTQKVSHVKSEKDNVKIQNSKKINKKFTDAQKKEYALNKQSKRKEYIEKFKNDILKYGNNIWKPKLNIHYDPIKTNSTFNYLQHTDETNNKVVVNIKSEYDYETPMRAALKVELHLTTIQKLIIMKWFKAYIKMYNATIHFIKNNKEIPINYKNIRTYHIKDIKKEIIEKSILKLNKIKNNKIVKQEITVKSHMLDGAIKLACANYQSALTNFYRGNIKQFRIRYWKMKKESYSLNIELSYFVNGSICFKDLGLIKATRDNKTFNLNDITTIHKTECKLKHDTLTDTYVLYVPTKVTPVINDNKKEIIILDPGIRTFMTGLSENEVVKIGTDIADKIKLKLSKIDTINRNILIPPKIKKKNIDRHNNKISNMIDEMQWQVINKLTSTYKTILIGDMSVQGITCNKTSNLTNLTKRVAYRFKFYTFQQRLEYKCKLRGVNYKVIDEKYTSQMCSICGHIDKELGGSRVYNCHNCKCILDRDVNGCRGIYIKSFW